MILSAALARASCPHPVDDAAEETLFTFNAMIYAASSVADPAQYNELRQFLLVYQPSDTLDRQSPIRRGIADAVFDWPVNLRQRILQFLLSHKAAATNYNALILQLVGPPPTFHTYDQEVPGGDNEQVIYNHRSRLAALMRETYRTGRLAQLWERWHKPWQDAQICVDHVLDLENTAATYMGMAAPPLPEGSWIIANPLMPFGSGVTCVYSDGHFVMIIGPTTTPREQDMLITHELSHPLLNALIRTDRRLRLALDTSDCVFDTIRRDGSSVVLTRYVYNTWESYFSESLVRSISHRLIFLPDPRNNFVLANFIDHELSHYESTGSGFNETLLRTLAALRRDYCMNTSDSARATAVAHRRQRFFHQ